MYIVNRFIILVSHFSPQICPIHILPSHALLLPLDVLPLPPHVDLILLLLHHPFLCCPLSIVALVEMCLLPPTPESNKLNARRGEDEEEVMKVKEEIRRR